MTITLFTFFRRYEGRELETAMTTTGPSTEYQRRKHPLRIGFLLSALSTVSACTTSLTSAPDISAPANRAVIGIPYTLPDASYELTAKWTFTGCKLITITSYPPGEDGKPGGVKNVKQAWQLEFDVALTKKDSLSAGETYVLDYRDISGAFKLAALKTEYHPGTNFLKSINASIEGKEAEATLEGIKLAAGLAKLAFTGNPVGGSVGDGRPTPAPPAANCTPEAANLFKALDEARSAIKKIPEETTALADELAVLSIRGNLGALSAADKKRIEAIQARTKELAKQLTELNADIAALEKRLSYTKTMTIGKVTAGSLEKVDLIPDKKALDALYAPLLTADGKTTLLNMFNNHALSLRAELTLPGKPAAIGGCNDDSAKQASNPLCKMVTKENSFQGIVYRNPAVGQLSVCRLKLYLSANPGEPAKVLCDSEKAPVLSEKVSVPQLGQLRLLPLKSGWGENNQLEATFDEKGTLTMAHYNRKAAPGLDALKTANAGMTELGGVLTAVDDYRQKKKDAAAAVDDEAHKAELEVLDRQIELLTKQLALQKLANPEADDPVLKELEARIAILKLQKEERDLLEAINSP